VHIYIFDSIVQLDIKQQEKYKGEKKDWLQVFNRHIKRMKFAERLAAHITPEWNSQYIKYDELKEFLYYYEQNAPVNGKKCCCFFLINVGYEMTRLQNS